MLEGGGGRGVGTSELGGERGEGGRIAQTHQRGDAGKHLRILQPVVDDVGDAALASSVIERFARLGGLSERSHIPGLIALDVPPSTPRAEVKRLLTEGEATERWGYEEACLPNL